ncbi:MAG: alginate export family protein [Bacteroidota bacterium]|nr:alginate export family protein [Bacteroidota bacterium]
MHPACRILLSLPVFFSWVFLCNAAGQGRDSTAQSAPLVRFGYQQRIRIETTDNAVGLSKDARKGTSYLRNRTSVWARIVPATSLAVDVRFTNECRYYFVPETRAFDEDEIAVDQLYLTWDKPARLPLTLKLGRQNIHLGEGFVVMDGAPLAGSRLLYFNAVRADWSFSPSRRLTLAYTYQSERDKILPVLGDKKRPLAEQPEEGIMAYYATDFFAGGAQAYFIRKNTYALESRPGTVHVNCPGVRFDYPVTRGLSLVGEAAAQFGSWSGNTMRAFGGYGYSRYVVGGKGFIPRSATLGGIYLSGDDPTTTDHEGWDPLFSRFPKWSESYIYALIPEHSVAYWSNFVSLYAGLSFDVAPELTFSIDYHWLLAPRAPEAGRSFPGGTGKTRGDLYIATLSYKPSKTLNGRVVLDHFKPGDFYFDGANPYTWMLMEVLVNL